MKRFKVILKAPGTTEVQRYEILLRSDLYAQSHTGLIGPVWVECQLLDEERKGEMRELGLVPIDLSDGDVYESDETLLKQVRSFSRRIPPSEWK